MLNEEDWDSISKRKLSSGTHFIRRMQWLVASWYARLIEMVWCAINCQVLAFIPRHQYIDKIWPHLALGIWNRHMLTHLKRHDESFITLDLTDTIPVIQINTRPNWSSFKDTQEQDWSPQMLPPTRYQVNVYALFILYFMVCSVGRRSMETHSTEKSDKK